VSAKHGETIEKSTILRTSAFDLTPSPVSADVLCGRPNIGFDHQLSYSGILNVGFQRPDLIFWLIYTHSYQSWSLL